MRKVRSGFRYYSPELGRWCSRDPIGTSGGRNLLAFTENNPVSSLDARGLKVAPITQADIGLQENSVIVTEDPDIIGLFVAAYSYGDTSGIGPVTGHKTCEYTFKVEEKSGGTIFLEGTETQAKTTPAGIGQTLWSHEWKHANDWIQAWNSYATIANYYEDRKYHTKVCAKLARGIVLMARKIKRDEYSLKTELWHEGIAQPVDSIAKALAISHLEELKPEMKTLGKVFKEVCQECLCDDQKPAAQGLP